ncbi:MAG TPA: hotdog fold thioesterase [Candidatus Acidoferrales bacterium]|nr:hotdog fold thioesterase [Candidatus Acidoferrales bacterium]
MTASSEEPIPGELAARMQDDPWARALGIEYVEIRSGYCRLRLSLQPHMVNFQGFPHGGVIFSVADIAFGTACNSHGDPAVALSMTISFMTAVAAGSRLVAEARQVKQGRQAAFYDVTVSTEGGVLVAQVHCVAHRLAR